jgi:hypothetical protein
MQLECPRCKRVLEFSSGPPAFCSFCGYELPQTNIHAASTVAYRSGEAAAGARAEIAQTVGEYRLVQELGRGGMGVVWEAEQASTGRRVALKLLSPALPSTDETRERFLREGRLAAALSHPRSTFVFGAGEHSGQPYIAMELSRA